MKIPSGEKRKKYIVLANSNTQGVETRCLQSWQDDLVPGKKPIVSTWLRNYYFRAESSVINSLLLLIYLSTIIQSHFLTRNIYDFPQKLWWCPMLLLDLGLASPAYAKQGFQTQGGQFAGQSDF